MFKKLFKQLNRPRYGTFLSLPDDLGLLVGESADAAEGSWMQGLTSKFRHVATDGRVFLSLDHTGTNLMIASAWVSSVDSARGGVDYYGAARVFPSEEVLGKDTGHRGRHTHPQIKRVGATWHPPVLQPYSIYFSARGCEFLRFQWVSSDLSVSLGMDDETVLRARAQAEQMGAVVRDSADRCSNCPNEYDTRKKESTWEWFVFWSIGETYYISRDGDVLLAIDRGVDESVIMSAIRLNDEGLRISWNVGWSALTLPSSMDTTLRMSKHLQGIQGLPTEDRNA